MNLSFYNKEIDKILWDTIGNDGFCESELFDIIDSVSETIHQYHKKLDIKKIKIIVHLLIEQKYKKMYVYNKNSVFNKAKKLKNSKLESNSESMEEYKANYSNPEIKKIESVIKMEDLVNHMHDYDNNVYKEAMYNRRNKQVLKIKKIPQSEQKSVEWFRQRNECLTATAISVVLDEDPYKYPIDLLFDKCGCGQPFIENENVHHGKKYEKIGTMFYSFRNNIQVAEYGLLQNEQHKFIGASPDGICEKYSCDSTPKLSKLVGRLLEIKFPFRRRINTTGCLNGDICPHYYFIQVQTQLFVTELDECDFLQCKIEEYENWNDFVEDTHKKIPGLSKTTNLEKGCLIQLLPKNLINGDPMICLYAASYIYPPKLHMSPLEIKEWIANEILNFPNNELSKEYVIDKIIYWRLSQVACNLIKFDSQWFESVIPQLKQFWNYVLFYRNNKSKLDDLIKFVGETGHEKTSLIFNKVHNDYLTFDPTTKYMTMYKKETEWRKKYNEEAKRKKNYMNYYNSKK